MADSEASRSLSIKTGVVTRLHKELLWYEAETQKEAAKIESLRASGACPHDVKQQENVASESAQMVPDCRQRLQHALADLEAVLVEFERHAAGRESAEVTAARAALKAASPLFE